MNRSFLSRMVQTEIGYMVTSYTIGNLVDSYSQLKCQVNVPYGLQSIYKLICCYLFY